MGAIETKKEVTEARIQQSVEAVAAAKASEDRLAHMLQVEERRAKHMVDELRNRVESQKIQITDLTQQASRSEAECEKLQSSNIAFEEETRRALESETAAKEDK